MHAFVGGGNVIARICGPSCSVRPRRARGLPVCFTFTPSSCDVVRALLAHPVLLGKFPASRWSPAFFLCKVRMTTRPARSGFTISDPSIPLSFRQPNEPIDFSGEVAWPIAAAALISFGMRNTIAGERGRRRSGSVRVAAAAMAKVTSHTRTDARTDERTDGQTSPPPLPQPRRPRRAHPRVESLSATGCSPSPPQSRSPSPSLRP